MVMLNKLDTSSGCLIVKKIGFCCEVRARRVGLDCLSMCYAGKLQNHHTKTTNSIQTYKNNIMH